MFDENKSEIEKEVLWGKDCAENLCQHLVDMGATQLEIPVTIESGCFVVNVRRTL